MPSTRINGYPNSSPSRLEWEAVISDNKQTICFPFIGDSVGGAQISTLLLACNLTPPYLPIIVVHEEGPLDDYIKNLGIKFYRLPLPRYVGRGGNLFSHAHAVLTTTPNIYRFLNKKNVSMVHCNDSRIHHTWTVPSWLSRRPLLWHQRSIYSPSRLTHHFMRGAKFFVCNSSSVSNSLPARYQRKALVVNNPFETKTPPPDRIADRKMACQEIGLSNDTKIIGFVGNLTRQKRPEIFLEAMAQLQARRTENLAFLLLGRDRDHRQGN